MNKTYTPRRDSPYKNMYWKETNQYTSSTICEDDYRAINPIWKELRMNRLKKDGYRCVLCGTAINVDVVYNTHHVKYPDAWGHETIDDVVTMCSSCHKKIHAKDISQKPVDLDFI